MRCRLSAVVLFALLSVFSALAVGGIARADGGADSLINVAGNRHTDAAMIRSYFHAAPGRPLDAAALDTALKALYATGLFADVKISHDGGRVLVTVVENPTIQQIAFDGNKKIKDADLKKAAAIEGRRAAVAIFRSSRRRAHGRALPSARLFPGANHPQTIKVTKGAATAKKPAAKSRRADAVRRGDTGVRVNLVFQIKEGDKLAVRKILFAGNDAFPAIQAHRRDQDRQDQFSELSARQRHLQCRPDRQRLRSVAAVLSRPRLRRCARALVCELRREI